jgi:predicted MPP superfamily phosphohydrolase
LLKSTSVPSQTETTVVSQRVSRRALFKLALKLGGAGVAVGAGATFYATRVEPHWVDVRQHLLPLRGLGAALDGARLVQISDLHIGGRVDPNYLERTARTLADLRPDLLVVTGDLTDSSGAGHEAEVERVLAALPAARLGRFAIFGNHDYGRGWREIDLADRLAARMNDAGVTLLANHSATIAPPEAPAARLQFVGFDDAWGPRFAPASALATRDPSLPAIALCHNPDVCDLDVWGDFDGWILAGHTHGGQCRVPVFGPPFLPVKNRRYTRGAFAVGGGRRLYINAGLGHLLRARFLVRPEVTVHTLRAV